MGVGVGDDDERGVGSFRYGDKLAKDTYYRFYAKYLNYDDLILALPMIMLMTIGKTHKGGYA